MAAYKKDVQGLLNEGFHAKWEAGSKLEPYVRRLAEAVSTFRDKADELLNKHEKIAQCLESLGACPIHGPTLHKIASRLQEAVDELNLAGYSNLDSWVRRLDKQLENILTDRLLHALEAWLATFSTDATTIDTASSSSAPLAVVSVNEHQVSSPRKVRLSYALRKEKLCEHIEPTRSTLQEAQDAARHRPLIRTSVHEILIRNQMMHLQPPLHHARQTFLQQLSAYLGTPTPSSFSCLHSCFISHYVSLQAPFAISPDFKAHATTIRSHTRRMLSVLLHPPTAILYFFLPFSSCHKAASMSSHVQSLQLARLPEGALRKVYESIEERLYQVSEYADIWLQYQALWDMEASAVFNRLGEDLTLWQRMLEEIKRSRRTFDNSESEKRFGPVVVVYGQVQSSVSHKYDLWHKDILQRFASRVAESMRAFYSTISGSRLELERHQVENESTADAVMFILRVQEIRKNLPAWGEELRIYANGQV